jgi:hypothetical protein
MMEILCMTMDNFYTKWWKETYGKTARYHSGIAGNEVDIININQFIFAI